MVSRRSFLAITGATAAGLTVGCRSGATAAAPAPAPSGGPARLDRIGVQLYTVRDQMEKDFTGTLERVARIGFKEVEFAGYFNRPPQEVRALLDRLGLTAPSTHIGLDALQKDLTGQVQAARTIGHEYITVPALMEPLMGRAVAGDYWSRTAAEFNRIARALKPEGIGFAYHNHSFEFEKLADGRTGYDVLLAETDPALVRFELDLFWATFAGQDPVAMFRRSPARYVMWHVKDMRGVEEARRQAAASTGNAMQKMQGAMPRLAAVGTGEIDFRRIFAQASTAGLRHFFVENDAAPNTPSSLGDIETSYQNLKRLLA
jgi:sugar phosphate isomerase/epimerase